MRPKDQSINYLELPAKDLQATVAFFEKALGWAFTWYGEDYVAFAGGGEKGAGVDGGFFRADACSKPANGGALIVLYAHDLESTQATLKAAGAKIVQDIFEFPGGRRFHFEEPSGNEFAVWSEPLEG